MRARERRVEGAPGPIHWFGPLGESSERFPDAEIWTPRNVQWSTRDTPRTDSTCEPTGLLDARGEPIMVERPLDCGLWRVSTYGFSCIRTALDGDSLTWAQLEGREPLPAGFSLAEKPAPLWVELELTPSASRRIRIDAGQTVYVNAGGVNVRWWAPGTSNPAFGTPVPDPAAEWVNLSSGNSGVIDVPTFEGFACEGLLFCEIARVESSRQQGQDYATLTETYFCDTAEEPDTFRRVPVPTGARRLYVSRDNTGAVTAARLEFSLSTATADAQRMTTIPIVNSQSIDPFFVTNATTVLLPLLGEPVLWTLIWEVAP